MKAVKLRSPVAGFTEQPANVDRSPMRRTQATRRNIKTQSSFTLDRTGVEAQRLQRFTEITEIKDSLSRPPWRIFLPESV
jgi:hypothetical protein